LNLTPDRCDAIIYDDGGERGDLYSRKALHHEGAGWSSGQPSVKGSLDFLHGTQIYLVEWKCWRNGDEVVLCSEVGYGCPERLVEVVLWADKRAR